MEYDRPCFFYKTLRVVVKLFWLHFSDFSLRFSSYATGSHTFVCVPSLWPCFILFFPALPRLELVRLVRVSLVGLIPLALYNLEMRGCDVTAVIIEYYIISDLYKLVAVSQTVFSPPTDGVISVSFVNMYS